MIKIPIIRRLLDLRGRELTIDKISNLSGSKLLCAAETLPVQLPLNIAAKKDLPSEKMNFGFSFQDVPGLPLSECRLVEIDNCSIEMLRDEWDSVFVDVKQNRSRVLFRGAGIPSNLAQKVRREPIAEWATAALPLEIWSGNYGHWIAYHLPKLLAFVEGGFKDDIVLPERGRWLNVEERDITYLSLIDQKIVRHHRLLQGVTNVKKLAIIDGDPHHGSMISNVANRMLGHVRQLPDAKRKRYYISRSNAGYRRLLNEKQLLEKLEDIGFESISLENLPILEQIEAFSRAECIVGMHGSGLANMIFCPADALIVEVIAEDFPCPDFYRLATTMGLGYCLAIADSVGDGKPGYRDLVAPVETIASLVSDILQ